ncbi:MAG: STAS domain-containing protein [Chitinophagales bacterium]
MEYTFDSKDERTLVVQLRGRMVGEYQTIELAEELDARIEEGLKRIIFEMHDLEYINSSGLNFFLKILTKVRRNGGEVVMCSLNELLLNLLVTTKLTSFFTICRNTDEALLHLEKENA